jgi:hypothetical protein
VIDVCHLSLQRFDVAEHEKAKATRPRRPEYSHVP